MKTDARKCLGAQKISRTSTWLIAFAELRSSGWLLFYTPLPCGTAPSIEPRPRAASPSNTGSISGRGKTLFSLTKGPGRLWYPSNILDNDQQELLRRQQGGQGVKLTIHLDLVPKLNCVVLYLHSTTRTYRNLHFNLSQGGHTWLKITEAVKPESTVRYI